MQLPSELRRAIEQELSGCDTARLRAAASLLSQCYRQAAEGENPAPNALTDDASRAAYLAVRLPATFAAVAAALDWTRELCNAEPCDSKIRSVLDLGSGPGTALWAAAQIFPSLESAMAIERDPQLIAIARRLVHNAGGLHSPSVGECGDQAADSTASLFSSIRWIQADLTTAFACSPSQKAGGCRSSRGCTRISSADGRLVVEATMRSGEVVIGGPRLEMLVAFV